MAVTFRERARSRTVDVSTSAEPAWAILLVAVTLAGGWLLTFWAGGTRTAVPHAFYIPIVIAAMRFGHRGALVASITAGLLAGPAMPLNVDDGTSQDLGNWIARLAAFVIVGQLVAFLSRHSLSALATEISDRRFRSELENALEDGQLGLLFQPIVDLHTGELTGVEALARWYHPTDGVIPPDQFVVRAERVGCVQLFTRHVLTEACKQLERWRTTSSSDGVNLTMAVNVSAADVADHGFCLFVNELLHSHDFPAHALHLEITETALVDDIDTMVKRLMDLRMLGIRLAIDDFGTGESSLGHLQRFPIDTVKVDRIFVSPIEHEQRNDVIAHGIVALAHAMQLETIAEGVETPAQAQLLRSFGCRHGQGYLIAEPSDAAHIDRILDDPIRFKERNRRRLHTSADLPMPRPQTDRPPESRSDDTGG